MLYFGAVIWRQSRLCRGGTTIGDVIRRAWSRLIRKQWLFLYPVALAVIDTLAFLAVYAAADGPLGWSAFFTANFERAVYVHDHFFASFQLSSIFGIAVFAGIASCLFAALIELPCSTPSPDPATRSRRGGGPKRRTSSSSTSSINLVVWVVPLVVPDRRESGRWSILRGGLGHHDPRRVRRLRDRLRERGGDAGRAA